MVSTRPPEPPKGAPCNIHNTLIKLNLNLNLANLPLDASLLIERAVGVVINAVAVAVDTLWLLGDEEVLIVQVPEDEVEDEGGDETDNGWTSEDPDDVWILDCVGASKSDSGGDGGGEEIEG